MLRFVILIKGPESVLTDDLALHTIEMIPKSMILVANAFADVYIILVGLNEVFGTFIFV